PRQPSGAGRPGPVGQPDTAEFRVGRCRNPAGPVRGSRIDKRKTAFSLSVASLLQGGRCAARVAGGRPHGRSVLDKSGGFGREDGSGTGKRRLGASEIFQYLRVFVPGKLEQGVQGEQSGKMGHRLRRAAEPGCGHSRILEVSQGIASLPGPGYPHGFQAGQGGVEALLMVERSRLVEGGARPVPAMTDSHTSCCRKNGKDPTHHRFFRATENPPSSSRLRVYRESGERNRLLLMGGCIPGGVRVMLTSPGESAQPPLGPGEIHSAVSFTVIRVPAGPSNARAGEMGAIRLGLFRPAPAPAVPERGPCSGSSGA